MKKIKSKSKCDQVAEEILHFIGEGKYSVNERIPSETVLAQQFGVSRATIRESIKKLCMMNIVTVKQGDGTFVNQVSNDTMMKPILPLLICDNISMLELFDARYWIEKGTAFLATKSTEKEPLNSLQKLILQMKMAIDSGNAKVYAELDAKFHLQLSQMTENAVFKRIYKTLQEVFAYQIKRINRYNLDMETSFSDHQRILDAMKTGDADLASQLMGEHIIRAKKFYAAEQNK